MNIEINLLGHKVVLKAADGDRELIEEVTELVARKIQAAEMANPRANIAAHQIALLALMDLGTEFVKAKRQNAKKTATKSSTKSSAKISTKSPQRNQSRNPETRTT